MPETAAQGWDRMWSLHVCNIPYSTFKYDLKEVFQKYAEVGDVFFSVADQLVYAPLPG